MHFRSSLWNAVRQEAALRAVTRDPSWSLVEEEVRRHIARFLDNPGAEEYRKGYYPSKSELDSLEATVVLVLSSGVLPEDARVDLMDVLVSAVWYEYFDRLYGFEKGHYLFESVVEVVERAFMESWPDILAMSA